MPGSLLRMHLGQTLKKEMGEIERILSHYQLNTDWIKIILIHLIRLQESIIRLPENNHVTIQIYDILGNLVTTLVNEEMEAGYHSVIWNASGYASGVYMYRFSSGSFITTKKLLLMK